MNNKVFYYTKLVTSDGNNIIRVHKKMNIPVDITPKRTKNSFENLFAFLILSILFLLIFLFVIINTYICICNLTIDF